MKMAALERQVNYALAKIETKETKRQLCDVAHRHCLRRAGFGPDQDWQGVREADLIAAQRKYSEALSLSHKVSEETADALIRYTDNLFNQRLAVEDADCRVAFCYLLWQVDVHARDKDFAEALAKLTVAVEILEHHKEGG